MGYAAADLLRQMQQEGSGAQAVAGDQPDGPAAPWHVPQSTPPVDPAPAQVAPPPAWSAGAQAAQSSAPAAGGATPHIPIHEARTIGIDQNILSKELGLLAPPPAAPSPLAPPAPVPPAPAPLSVPSPWSAQGAPAPFGGAPDPFAAPGPGTPFGPPAQGTPQPAQHGSFGSAPFAAPPGPGAPFAAPPGPGTPQPPRTNGQPASRKSQPLQTPPYLASQTAARMISPQEPWADTLGTLMLVLGIALIACFVLPWRLSPDVSFSWSVLAAGPGKLRLSPLLIAGTGVLAVVLSLLPLTVLARGIAAAALGLVPLAILGLVVEPLHWTSPIEVLASATLVSGLLLRSEYSTALTARVLVTVGVVCTLFLWVLPQNGHVPLATAFDSIASAPIRVKIVTIFELLWIVPVLLALLAWLPAPSTGGAKILAWVLITEPVAMSVLRLLVGTPPSGLAEVLKAGLYPQLLAPVALMAWRALTGYGLATVVAKRLEHR